METLGSGAAVLDLLFQIGSYRSILFDFGTDISAWTFEFYLKKNKGDRLKTLSLTLGSGLSFPVYESDQIQAIFSSANTSIQEGQYYYELRRTDIALPLINGFAYFTFDAPQGTIEDTTLELTVSQQVVSLTISNISAQGGGGSFTLTDGNGTTADGTSVGLGGPLNQPTVIDAGVHGLIIKYDDGGLGVGTIHWAPGTGLLISMIDAGGSTTELNFGTFGDVIIQSNAPGFPGFKYGANNSANYQDDSLPAWRDVKAYSDTLVAGYVPATRQVAGNALSADVTAAQIRTALAIITAVPINAVAGGAGVVTLTNMTNVEQIFPNGASVHLFKFDATNYQSVRLTTRVSTLSASVNDPRLFMRYSTDNGSNWIIIGAGTSASGDALSLSATNNQAFTNWVALPAGAKADVLFQVAQNGGDGAADPAVCNVYVFFRT